MHGHVLFVFVGLQCQQNATRSLVNFVSGDPRPHQCVLKRLSPKHLHLDQAKSLN